MLHYCPSFPDNKLTTFGGLKGLSALVTLHCGKNRFSSLKSLPRLKNLEELFVAGNRLTSVRSAATACPQLDVLDLQDNRLVDVSAMEALGPLTSLAELWVSGNPLCDDLRLVNRCVCVFALSLLRAPI
jgi:Leucine-rich repeat (LRR) protein